MGVKSVGIGVIFVLMHVCSDTLLSVTAGDAWLAVVLCATLRCVQTLSADL